MEIKSRAQQIRLVFSNEAQLSDKLTVKLTELLTYHFIEFPSFCVKWLEASDAQVERHNWRTLLLLHIPKLHHHSIISVLDKDIDRQDLRSATL